MYRSFGNLHKNNKLVLNIKLTIMIFYVLITFYVYPINLLTYHFFLLQSSFNSTLLLLSIFFENRKCDDGATCFTCAKVYGKNRALEKVCVFGIISNI
jgi:hypothetical protein